MANVQNLASGTLTSSISASTTSLSVYVGEGSSFVIETVWPATPFYATIMPAVPNAGVANSLDSEIVEVTAVSNLNGNTILTVNRGQKGTTAKAFDEGAVVTNGIYMDDVGSPTGTISMFAGSTAPTGYLICDGSAVSRTTYAGLFGVIGTAYGTGDGSTTFNLPNLKGRVAVGKNAGDTSFDTLGETGGEKTHKLTTTEMPSHRHHLRRDGAGVYMGIAGGPGSGNALSGNFGTTSIWPDSIQAESVGGSGAHNNLQPYIVLNYIIKY